MYDTVLVPVDGSDHSIRAAEYSLGLAERFDGRVHLLNVVDVSAAAGPFSVGGVDEEFVSRLESEGENVVEDVKAAVDGGGVSLETAVVRGRPADEILDYAGAHDADLLAMGTQGRTGLDRHIMGSVTERVLRQTQRPLFTVNATTQSEFEGGFDDILIPTDGSEAAETAIDHAVTIASQFDARVHAVNVVDVNAASFSPAYTPPAELIENLTAHGEEATARIASAARDADLSVTTAVRKGLPSDSLLDYVETNGIDLIVMATAGRSGLSRYLVGSTTENVLRRATVPVLAVNKELQT